MSRTYRVRGTGGHISRKWVDGVGSTMRWSQDNHWWGIMAHGIYALPCLVEGKPLVQVKTETRKWRHRWKKDANGNPLMEQRSYQRLEWQYHYYCLVRGGIDWLKVRESQDVLQGVPTYKVATLAAHPYARTKNPLDRQRERAESRSERRTNRIRIYQLIRSNDLDLI